MHIKPRRKAARGEAEIAAVGGMRVYLYHDLDSLTAVHRNTEIRLTDSAERISYLIPES